MRMDKYNDKEIGANILRDYAYKNGTEIYDFMKKHKFGESAYGKIMDAAAKDKHVVAHRLYGHHLVSDFPLGDVENIPDFLEHLLSDLFTKQGLPILPGELLEDLGLLKYCDKLTKSWNFVNGFDILAGTVAIYKSYDKFMKAYNEIESVDDFKDLSNTIGIGVIELSIALSTSNPFLLIGAVLHMTSGIKGLLNNGATIYFHRIQDRLTVEFSAEALNVEKYP